MVLVVLCVLCDPGLLVELVSQRCRGCAVWEAVLSVVYLGALEQAWAPVAADDDDDAAQQRFGAVAARIASTYAGE